MKSLFKTTIAVSFFLLFLVSSMAWADDVIDTINEAKDYYESKDYSAAVSSLEYATQLIQQKKGETLEKALPEPLNGWTGKKAESQAVGAAMLGGGLTAERVYHKDNSRIKINIIADSPMIQSVMMMLSNPMILASGGGKLKKIKGQRAAVKYNFENKSGEIQVVVANRFLVTVSGNEVEEKDLVDYAGAIDYKQMIALP